MKKISNINFGGRIILIENNAYEYLSMYMESLRHYFKNEDGKHEILNDIEVRVGELMYERAGNIVTQQDVESIINCMGKIEDFDAMYKEEEEETPQFSNYSLQNAYQYSASAWN